MALDKKIILASSSPRRKQLLEGIGVSFDVHSADIDEFISETESPEEAVSRLAHEKAECVSLVFSERIVLAADTVVVLEDGAHKKILGKPKDLSDARSMLSLLSAGEHSVFSAFSLVCRERGISSTHLSKSVVVFRKLSELEIDNYLSRENVLDKAGAYAIQGVGGSFVSEIRGSYQNIVGLPLSFVIEEFKKLGLWASYE